MIMLRMIIGWIKQTLHPPGLGKFTSTQISTGGCHKFGCTFIWSHYFGMFYTFLLPSKVQKCNGKWMFLNYYYYILLTCGCILNQVESGQWLQLNAKFFIPLLVFSKLLKGANIAYNKKSQQVWRKKKTSDKLLRHFVSTKEFTVFPKGSKKVNAMA